MKKSKLTTTEKLQKFTHFMLTRKRGDVTKLADMLYVTPQCISRMINFHDVLNDKTINAMYKLTRKRNIKIHK